MSEMIKLSMTVTMGLTLMSMAACVGGAWACFAHRRLCPLLLVASVGLLGEALASAVGHLAARLLPATLAEFYTLAMVSDFLRLISTVVLVFGLGLALADIRRKLARSMEPKHVRN